MEKIDVRNRHDQSTPGSIDGPSPRTHDRPLLIDCPIQGLGKAPLPHWKRFDLERNLFQFYAMNFRLPVIYCTV